MDILTAVPRPHLDNAVMTAFIISVAVFTVVEGATCNHLQSKEFVSALNKELRLVSYWEKITQSPVICVNYCHSDPNCQSVNHHISSRLCQLNNVTRAQYPDDFITLYGSVYFDADVATQLLSQSDKPPPSVPLQYTDCKQLLETGNHVSGIYTIFPAGFSDGLQVYCDMETDGGGGGWIVIQRRVLGGIDFYRDWEDYRTGFGNMSAEFWFGNDNIRTLTTSAETWQLRVDLEDQHGDKAWATYNVFQILGENFQLRVDSYDPESTAGEALGWHNGMMFSTKDRDNDGDENDNMAVKFEGAWWFGPYVFGIPSDLNGQLRNEISWTTWPGKTIYKCSMKTRIVQY